MIHIVRDRAARRQATAYSPHIIHQSWLKDGHQVPDRTRQTEHGVIEPGLGCIVVTWYSLFCSPGGLFRKDSRRRRDRMTERERERERVCVCVSQSSHMQTCVMSSPGLSRRPSCKSSLGMNLAPRVRTCMNHTTDKKEKS